MSKTPSKTQSKTRSKTHVILVDGTQSRLDDGHETHIGNIYKLLGESLDPKTSTLWYHSGIQGHGLWNWVTIASGWGINQIIQEAYGFLSSNYTKGDRIFLFGFSRGAYAVRSLAGMIDRLGLLRQEEAIARNINYAFRLYETTRPSDEMTRFCQTYCHKSVEIDMIGAFDTVKALGISFPLLSRLAPMATHFHNDQISPVVKAGFHALALDENRTAYRPELWHLDPNWHGRLEQAWFRGAHSDVGGHVWRHPKARPLANLSLIWMLGRAQELGLELPADWNTRFPTDAYAPMLGNRRGIARFFLYRKPRTLGQSAGEMLHPSALLTQPELAQKLAVMTV